MAEPRTPEEVYHIVVALSHEAAPYNALVDALAGSDIPAGRYEVFRSSGEEHLRELIGDAEVVVAWHLEPEYVRRGKKLRWVHFASAGVDQALSPELVESDILVSSSVGIHKWPVAESAFAMILAFARGLVPAFNQQRERSWERRRVADAMVELHDLTLGVIGLGHIGREVARLGRAFGMQVLGLDTAAAAEAEVDELFGRDGLGKLLSHSDFVVLCLPLTAETRGMFALDEIRVMKPTAYLINVARGSLLQEAILIEALRRHWIAGAGLDVFEHEPLPPNHPLYNLDNVILTPHVAGVTPHYWDRMARVFVDNFRRFLAGEPLATPVDKARGF